MNSPGDTARYNAPASPPDGRASCEARKSPSGDCTARPLASRLVVTKEIHGFRHHAYRPAHSPPAPGSENAAGSRDRGEAVGRVPVQVERHLTGISLSSLVNVAKALGVPLGALIDHRAGPARFVRGPPQAVRARRQVAVVRTPLHHVRRQPDQRAQGADDGRLPLGMGRARRRRIRVRAGRPDLLHGRQEGLPAVARRLAALRRAQAASGRQRGRRAGRGDRGRHAAAVRRPWRRVRVGDDGRRRPARATPGERA